MSDEIVILSPFFYPEQISTGKYNGVVAEALARRGYNVKVICSYPIYPDWTPSDVGSELAGITAFRGGRSIVYPRRSILRRMVLEIWYAFHVARTLRKVWTGGRVVAILPPSLFMLVVRSLINGKAPVIGIVHDLQDIYAARKASLVGRVLSACIRWVESRAFHACDQLIFLSETMKKRSVAAYQIDPAQVVAQYPFVSTVDEPSDVTNEQLDSFFEPHLRSLVYSGALGEKQAPVKMLNLMISILDSHPNWQARVFSQGPIFDQLRQRFTHSRLEFHPLVDASLLPSLLRRSDVQLIPQDSGTSDGSLPSKLPNIIAARTSILCITDSASELEEVVSKYEAGEVSNTWDTRACLDAFDRLLRRPKASVAHSQELLSKFSLEGLLDKLLSIPA